MHHLGTGTRRLFAVPLGLLLTAALGMLPGPALASDSSPAAPEPSPSAGTGTLTYVVNTSTQARTFERVRKAVAQAEGSVTVMHRRIGVIVAKSAHPDFARKMRAVRGVDSAGATRTAALEPSWNTQDGGPEIYRPAASQRSDSAQAEEPLEKEQWDLAAIKADKAHEISTGSSKVTVGVIDTGVDDTHPDLSANFSAAQSANCVGGIPDTSEGAWRPYDPEADYHGTHVAGEIAAARNGLGIAGVAPGVRLASIKVSEPETALFYPEAVICAFLFAADKSIEITNNSYFIDPWLYNCTTDPDQGAMVEAVGRASAYAQKKGILHIASAGNSNDDLAADEIVDEQSPNDTTPVTRTIDPEECLDLPTQLPSVMTVTATGVQDLKSFYSSYGLRFADVAAPGGDSFQIPGTPSKNGRILSTLPGGQYGFLQGTSMASPHAAGVAALLKSTRPAASPAILQLLMKLDADNPGCPEFYDPDGNGKEDSTCEGVKRFNGFYGWGIVDALDAVRN